MGFGYAEYLLLQTENLRFRVCGLDLGLGSGFRRVCDIFSGRLAWAYGPSVLDRKVNAWPAVTGAGFGLALLTLNPKP